MTPYLSLLLLLGRLEGLLQSGVLPLEPCYPLERPVLLLFDEFLASHVFIIIYSPPQTTERSDNLTIQAGLVRQKILFRRSIPRDFRVQSVDLAQPESVQCLHAVS